LKIIDVEIHQRLLAL